MYAVAWMPAVSSAGATTGPAIAPAMTSAVRTLGVVTVDMGSLLHVVFVGCFCADITHGNPAILWLPPRGRVRLVRASVRERWTGMGASSRLGSRRRCWGTDPEPFRVL